MRKLKRTIKNLAGTDVSYAPQRKFRLPMFQRNSADQQMSTMGAVGTIFSIVNRTSTTTAGVDWHLYKKAKSGREEDRVEVTSHPAIDKWEQPNDFYTRQKFVEAVQQHIDLTGEGWWFTPQFKGYKGLGPSEMWPIRPDWITPVPSADNFLDGYVFRTPDGMQVPLDVNEVVSILMPNPHNPYRGMGPVQALLYEIDGIHFAAQWNRNFFLNGAEPGGVVEVPDTIGDTDFRRLQAQFGEEHKGVHNAHKVALLTGGAKWVDIKYTNRDMQFTELRNLSRELIWEGFGISKAILGIVQDVNRANNDAQDEMFARYLSVPRLERWKGALNNNFLPMFGKGENKVYEFDYDNPIPEDQELENATLKARTDAYNVLVSQAGVEPEDAAKIVGLPPMRHHTIQITSPKQPEPASALNGHKPAARIEIVNVP
jgi:HK97 family phage portal protein